jgi:Glycosyltransferase sugar-binding region containing DXD motif
MLPERTRPGRHGARTQSTGVPIIQYWHSAEVPDEVSDWIASFRELNPELRHLLFDERSAEELIGERFGSREVAAFRSCAVPAMQADYFRYCAVLALGGVYVDAGFRCLQSLRDLIEAVPGGTLFSNPGGKPLINGFFLFTAPCHPLLRLAVDVATSNIERRASEVVSQVTGPWIFSSLAAVHRDGSLRHPRRPPVVNAPLVDSIAAAIGSYERVERAFEDVRIVPFDVALKWIARPDSGRRYKQSETRWASWPARRGTIFR